MKKRIALVGNMNNNFFALTRYLRDAGYDAHLFYRLAMEHFQPKADTYTTNYDSYCHKVDWLENGFHNADLQDVRATLEEFNYFIGQGEEAAAAYAAGYNMDIYYPYGSDVYKYAQLPAEYKLKSKLASIVSKSDKRPSYKQMQLGTMAKYLRGAIADARYILADPTNDSFETELNKLNYRGIHEKVGLPFIYIPEYDALNIGNLPANEQYHKMTQLRAEHDFIMMYHGRQEWSTYHNAFTSKNTHHLILGFADYIKKTEAVKACLVLLAYGSDVAQSKQLIAELGITDNVHWLPVMYRKELMPLLACADVCCGEFNHGYLTFGTVIEAMLMNKPVINYRDESQYTDAYDKLYPCFNAREPLEVANAIAEAAGNPARTKQMGIEAHEWVLSNFIKTPLARLIDIIETKA